MRIAGILALMLLSPLTVCAALININTADAALLDTLPGIGPSKAQAIVDYRTQNGLFARIDDIQKVSGIGPSTYADIQSFITVGTTESSQSTSTSSPAVATSSPANSAYVPPPSSLSLSLVGPTNASLHIPVRFSAHVVLKNGSPDPSALLVWSFGDGSSQTGTLVEKTYQYPGTYLVTVRASDGFAEARDERTVVVGPGPRVTRSVSGEGITVINQSDDRLDLSFWRLLADTGSFRIPEGTVVLPHASVLFPFVITNLPITSDVSLLYPDGVAADTSLAAGVVPTQSSIDVQPQAVVASSYSIQEVDTPLTTQNIHSHDQAVVAPTASSELAAVAAPFTQSTSTTLTPGTHSLLGSPWIIGLLGIIVAAGGAFIFI